METHIRFITNLAATLILLCVSVINAETKAVDVALDEAVDVGLVLSLAQEDQKAGRYDDALKKYQWFYHNALEYDQAMYGVRLSFALGDWFRLGNNYPPAMQALQDEAEIAEQRVLDEAPNYPASFHDFAAINEAMQQNADTVGLFKRVDSVNADKARKILVYAKRSLLQAKEYALMRKHIDPRESLRMTFIQHDSLKNNATDELKVRMRELADEVLIDEAGNLVALLSVLNESSLAGEIKRSALKKSDNELLKQVLAQAEKGVFPVPRY